MRFSCSVMLGHWIPVWLSMFWLWIEPLLDWPKILTRQSQYQTTTKKVILPSSDQCSMISSQLLSCYVTLPSVFLHAHEIGTNE